MPRRRGSSFLPRPLHQDSVQGPWKDVISSVDAEIVAAQSYAKNLFNIAESLANYSDKALRRHDTVEGGLTKAKKDHIEYKATTDKLRASYSRKVTAYLELAGAAEDKNESTSNDGTQWPPLHWAGSDTSVGSDRRSSGASNRDRATSPAPAPKHFISGVTAGGPAPVDYPTAGKSGVFDNLKNREWNLMRAFAGNNKNPLTVTQEVSRLKREAEESDRQYRLAIFHLESLRLQVEHLSRASTETTNEMAGSLSQEFKETFLSYVDNIDYAGRSALSISHHLVSFSDVVWRIVLTSETAAIDQED